MSAYAEARVGSAKDEKGRLLEELLECERQIVLWEKKLTLEKETQETLDPTAGVLSRDRLHWCLYMSLRKVWGCRRQRDSGYGA
jgi:hypothetical protein